MPLRLGATENCKDLAAAEEATFGVRAGETVVEFACPRANLETQAAILLRDRFPGLGIETIVGQYFVKIRTLSLKN
jgi:hypothetical protein